MFCAHAVQLAGDELQLRVAKRRAAAVGQRDPAVDVARLVVARDGEHVVGVPRQLAGQIRRFDAMPRGAAVVERPDERRAREEGVGQLGKPNVIGVQARDDLAVDPPDRLVVVAQQVRCDLFLAAWCRLPAACARASRRGRRTCAAASRARADRIRSSVPARSRATAR